jgi:ubiquinone/menaquinone biosynthesis C-methylase UbiE
MSFDENVSEHYTHGNLLNAVKSGIEQLGKTSSSITVEDLAPLDEFHIGGRQASENFFDQLSFSAEDHLIDVGCGLGGASRFVAKKYDSKVTGIDLTPDYIETGKALCTWLGLDNLVDLQQGSALNMPFEDDVFDGGYMMHVGMNIKDKIGLYKEICRVLRSGASFGVYDVMMVKEGELIYPVPWATTTNESKVASPGQYKQAMEEAGFRVTAENNRREFALSFFEQLRKNSSNAGGPPPLGIHILMGNNSAAKIQNMIKNVSAGHIAPVELIARKN